MVVLYRCVCSRNYAEWRSSWGADGRGAEDCQQQQVVLEALPLRLTGHTQQVECLETDGQLLVTCCLAGQVRVWDAITGDCVRLVGVSGLLLSGRTGPGLGRHHRRLCQVSESVWSPAVWPDRSGSGTPSLETVRLVRVSGLLLSGRTGPGVGRHHWRLCQVSGSVWSPAVWPDRSGCGTPSLETVSG